MTTQPGIDARMTATTGEPIGQATPRSGGRRLPRAYYAVSAVAPLLILAVWGVLLLAGPAAPTVARVGQPAPEFTLTDLDGNRLSLAELRGRPVIVNFWASTCGPCRDEFPLLASAAAAHEGEQLAVVGIVFRDGAEPAREFLAQMGATWPSAMDPNEAVAARFGIIWPPDTFFIDRDGVVVRRQIGELSAADLERGLAKILAKE